MNVEQTRIYLAEGIRSIVQGKSQKEIGDALDIRQSEVSRFMSGSHDDKFSIDRLIGFVNRLGRYTSIEIIED